VSITYVNTGAITDIGSGSATVAYPAGIAANDVLLVLGFQRNSANTVNPPSSTLTWTEESVLGVHFKAWSAVYDGAATAPTANSGGARCFYVMLAFRGVDTVTPVNGDEATTTAVQTNMRYPALTVPLANMAIVTFCKSLIDNSGVAPAAGFTEVVDYVLATSYGAHVQYQIQTTATNIVQTDLTVTGGSSVTQRGMTLALTAAGSATGIVRRSQLAGGINQMTGGV
jgi:hypothetical protein